MIRTLMAKISFEKTETAYRIQLQNPPLNILDIPMLQELRDALAQVQEDRALLVISAAGDRAFCAGVSVQDHVGDKIQPMLSAFHDSFRMLNRVDAVTIALVNGAALGGGCELAFACDFVLASDKAKFGLPEIQLGVFPPIAAYQVSRQTSPRLGLELLLTGDTIDAATALQAGLVNAVFAANVFEAQAREWMSRLTRHSPSSLRFAKRAVRLAGPDEFETKLHTVERLYLDELMSTSDAAEGLNAFMEKRPPAWKGR